MAAAPSDDPMVALLTDELYGLLTRERLVEAARRGGICNRGAGGLVQRELSARLGTPSVRQSGGNQ